MTCGVSRVATLLILLGSSLVASPSLATDYALIVGINDYSANPQFGNLAHAESDSRALANYFRAQGFEVTLLLGSERRAREQDIGAAVDALSLRIGGDDRFVFSFSGHGTSLERDGVTLGYLVPQQPEDNGISAGELQRYSQVLGAARHQLFLFASCYGGLLGQLPRRAGARFNARSIQLEQLGKRRSRWYLSAGGGDQQVLDGGPSNLSWFTYFSLKALEPGIVSHQAQGVLTFSSWASFVQAYSANPHHTPSFGTMAGDQGGQFLMGTTDTGRPQLPKLPKISEATLNDLGFLSRGRAEYVRATVAEMKAPIDRLFRAWEDLDIEAYMDQFNRNVVQTGRFKSGKTYSRGYAEIESKRRKFFPKLERVDVVNYDVMYQGLKDGVATFAATYTMVFTYRDPDRAPIRETNVKECYQTARDSDGTWRIVRNDDYQQRLCTG